MKQNGFTNITITYKVGNIHFKPIIRISTANPYTTMNEEAILNRYKIPSYMRSKAKVAYYMNEEKVDENKNYNRLVIRILLSKKFSNGAYNGSTYHTIEAKVSGVDEGKVAKGLHAIFKSYLLKDLNLEKPSLKDIGNEDDRVDYVKNLDKAIEDYANLYTSQGYTQSKFNYSKPSQLSLFDKEYPRYFAEYQFVDNNNIQHLVRLHNYVPDN